MIARHTVRYIDLFISVSSYKWNKINPSSDNFCLESNHVDSSGTFHCRENKAEILTPFVLDHIYGTDQVVYWEYSRINMGECNFAHILFLSIDLE